MTTIKTLQVIGVASGLAAGESGTANGPLVLQKSPYLKPLSNDGLELVWSPLLKASTNDQVSVMDRVSQLAKEIAASTQHHVEAKHHFLVLGGDHSSAIGTWSGVSHAKNKEGPIGLIWIDAHMDSHTPETSPSGNIHGMPVAVLLGYGDKRLTDIMNNNPKIKPEHLCLIGIRSYEQGESDLLNTLKVKIFYMEEVKQRGLAQILEEAKRIVTNGTSGYGVTIDVDSMDPEDAPATGVAEPGGISANELINTLGTFANDSKLLGVELVEFDPSHDIEEKTEKLIPKLIKAINLGA